MFRNVETAGILSGTKEFNIFLQTLLRWNQKLKQFDPVQGKVELVDVFLKEEL